ncbi:MULTISPECIES: signal peptidase II [Aphanothece]|uniref:signal peptidase II n=1 Tax=Aphanothece TaxID=1121 RepID=UPI003985507A
MTAPQWRSYGLAALIVLLDQLSKAWASANLVSGLPQPFLPGVLALQLTHNTGAAFSLFTGATQMLGLVSLLVGLGVVIWIRRQAVMTLPRSLAVGFLLGGAVGNGIDRWRMGAVVDFLAFVPVAFPVFNIADIAINLAVLCFAIDLLRGHGHRRV